MAPLGKFDGEYKGVAPTGETIEMFGVTVAKVDDDLRLLQVEHFFDNNQLLSKLAGGCPDLQRSLAFYTDVGYEVVGEVAGTGPGHLTMLKLPGDEFVTIELVHDRNGAAVDTETRLSHLVIQVDSMEATLTELASRGIDAEPPTSPDGSDDFRTTWIVDPDGNRIELVQWPAGHAEGMTGADFQE